MMKFIVGLAGLVGLFTKAAADYILWEMYAFGIKFQEAHLQSGDSGK